MATPRTAAKKKPAKKRATKKPTKRAAAAAKPNGKPTKKKGKDTGPLELVIKSELMKFKLQAVELVFEKENTRIQTEMNQKFSEQLAREKRNDPAWLKAQKARKEALNELITKQTDGLPEGYAITNINPTKSTYTAIYDPARRGELAK